MPEKFVWGGGRGGVVCKVIFMSNPTVVLCCVEVRVRVGVLTIKDYTKISMVLQISP